MISSTCSYNQVKESLCILYEYSASLPLAMNKPYVILRFSEFSSVSVLCCCSYTLFWHQTFPSLLHRLYQQTNMLKYLSILENILDCLSCIIACCSIAQSYPTLCTPWTAARQASLSITISWSLLKLMSIESMMPFNHLILCHPLLLLPSIFPSNRVFSNEAALCIRWPKYWRFSISISPSSEYSRLISFRIDWLNLLAI